MDLKGGFSRFLKADDKRLHFAAHSHHPWPDVSFEAHNQAWLDAVAMADDKWDHVFGSVVPAVQRLVADILGLSDPTTLTFGPNTHGFVTRLFSCFEPPVRILTTDSEFHSFNRQSRRWEESGLALIDRIAVEPFESFEARFTKEASAGAHDLIYLSQVFFDSGFVVRDLDMVVSAVPNNQTFIVVDGYHAFMAMPVNIGAIQDRVFYLAGGYKYAMSGEGACFLHSPHGYGARPVNTGWYAGFGQLESGVSDSVAFGSDGSRFAGATYDPSGLYRMKAVLEWLTSIPVTPADIHAHVSALQERFLLTAPAPGDLLVPTGETRGNFLTFRNQGAVTVYEALHDQGVITDYRADRLRIGFGVYHDIEDVDRLAEIVDQLQMAD